MKRFRAFIGRQLRTGLSPNEIALTIALGAVIGVFPILGTTTMLCAVAALALRLNLVLIQAVNYAMYPVWAVLVIPFVRLGGFLFSANVRALTLSGMIDLERQGFYVFVEHLFSELFHAVIAWLVVAPIAILVVRAGVLLLVPRTVAGSTE